MKYAPGSFSKNFAWHGTGMRKLHISIRNGFRNTLLPVSRQTFRSEAAIESSIILIPLNFFLHNRDEHISVDELIFQALEQNHSAQFDRLALFALHLNRVGTGRDSQSGRKIISRPAMWANEFVREQLWLNGTWQKAALADDVLDGFLSRRMDAQSNVRIKCRNNYRHMFDLCKYTQPNLPIVNSGADQWIGSALFLAWDRHILDGGARRKSELIALIDKDELYKLLGVSRDYTHTCALALVDLYKASGHIYRFGKAERLPPEKKDISRGKAKRIAERGNLEWLVQEESDEMVRRRAVERREQKRDRRKAGILKVRYNNTCQFCGKRLGIGGDKYYSEAAHIKGLGEPHNGPDKLGNMLVLCPNHHLQFDRGVLRLIRAGKGYRIQSTAVGDVLNGQKITLNHALEDDCVKYHYDWFD